MQKPAKQGQDKIWIPRIRYEIILNLDSGKSMNTYTNMPVRPMRVRTQHKKGE